MRTPKQTAQLLADMRWGDSLSALKIGARESHNMGKSYVELLEALQLVVNNVDPYITALEGHPGVDLKDIYDKAAAIIIKVLAEPPQ